MSADTWIPGGISLDQPSVARIYDYWLGGHHNFEIDRVVGEKAKEIYPDVVLATRAARAFLRRVVQFLVAQGVDQFLDIGSGIPTLGNVHEVAQKANPAARVVYVDRDPVAVAHSRAILAGNPNAAAIQANARQPEQILSQVEVKGLLDFSRPVGLLFLSVLHYILDDEEAYGVIHTLCDALAPGSYLAVVHSTRDDAPPAVLERMQQLGASADLRTKLRSRAEVLRFLDGFELVEPGLVHIPLWWPEGPDDIFLDFPGRSLGWACVGRKP